MKFERIIFMKCFLEKDVKKETTNLKIYEIILLSYVRVNDCIAKIYLFLGK